MLKKKFIIATHQILTSRQSAKVIRFANSVSSRHDIPNTQKGVLSIDLKYVNDQKKRWQNHMNPIIPYYAIKSLPDKKVIQSLTHFDCASKEEIKNVLSEGVPPGNIIYANTTKSEPYIKFANNNGVNLMTADSVSECKKIMDIDKQIKIVLRLAVNDAGARTTFSSKFGITNFEQLVKIVDYINNNDGNLHGFSFHVGSGQDNVLLYKEALDKVDIAIDHIRWKHPQLYKNISMINIGGGFTHSSDLKKLRTSIDPYIKKYSNYKWIAEPGRYFSENAGILICPVIGEKYIGTKKCFVIADNIYQTFSNIKYDSYKVVFNSDELGDDGVIFGNSCDSQDVIFQGRLPQGIGVGTIIIFLHTGAYTSASSCNFNGLEKPEIVYNN